MSEDKFMSKITAELFYGYAYNPKDKQLSQTVEQLNERFKKMSGDTFIQAMCKRQGFETFEDVIEMCNVFNLNKITLDDIVDLLITGNVEIRNKLLKLINKLSKSK